MGLSLVEHEVFFAWRFVPVGCNWTFPRNIYLYRRRCYRQTRAREWAAPSRYYSVSARYFPFIDHGYSKGTIACGINSCPVGFCQATSTTQRFSQLFKDTAAPLLDTTKDKCGPIQASIMKIFTHLVLISCTNALDTGLYFCWYGSLS